MGVRKTFNIYTKDEIQDYDKLPHWKDGVKGLVRTDDGYALDCLRVIRSKVKKGEITTIVLSVGRFIVGKTNKFLWERKREFGNWGTGYKTYAEREVKKTSVKSFITQYVRMFLLGKVDYNKLASIVGNHIKVKSLLKDVKVQEMIKDEINQVLSKEGITAEFVLSQFKEAIDMSKNNRDPGALLRAAENLAKMLEMYPTMTRQTQTMEYSLTGDIQKMIQDYDDKLPEKKLELTQTVEQIES